MYLCIYFLHDLFVASLYHSLFWFLLLLWLLVSLLLLSFLLIFPLLLLLLLLALLTKQLRINRHIAPFDQFQIFPLNGFLCRSIWYSPGGGGAGSALR